MTRPDTLWSPGADPDAQMLAYTVGDDREVDARLLRWDVLGSLGHIEALRGGGIISTSEHGGLRLALRAALQAVEREALVIEPTHEDVHSAVESWLTAKNYESTNCLIINWAFFGDNNLTDFDIKNTSVLNRFTKRNSSVHPQFKSICKLNPNLNHNIHWSNEGWTDTSNISGNSPFNPSGNYEIAQLNHYFCKTKSEFLNKINRGNACRSGIDGKRNLSDFDDGNFNEVDDFTAYNFYKN